MRSRYSCAVIVGTGPISATLLPPRVAPPLAPRVNSHTLPATSAASEVGPAAACASASVAKVSSRQYSDPAGSSFSFLSATGLISNLACARDADGHSISPIAPTARTVIMPCRSTDVGDPLDPSSKFRCRGIMPARDRARFQDALTCPRVSLHFCFRAPVLPSPSIGLERTCLRYLFEDCALDTDRRELYRGGA